MNTETIQIWHGNMAADNAYYKNYWRVLDASEQAHAEKIKNDLLHKRFVESHGRLRNILAQVLNEPPEQLNIKKTDHGKPYLADTPGLVFNLSHSENMMVIAVAWNCQLGVDIECCKSRGGLAGLVDKCFAEEEIVHWKQLPEDKKVTEFYRFWTRKEAFVKATGRGIGLGLSRCVINPENQSEFLRVPADYGQASTWHALDIDLGQGVRSALVTDKDIDSVRVMAF